MDYPATIAQYQAGLLSEAEAQAVEIAALQAENAALRAELARMRAMRSWNDAAF